MHAEKGEWIATPTRNNPSDVINYFLSGHAHSALLNDADARSVQPYQVQGAPSNARLQPRGGGRVGTEDKRYGPLADHGDFSRRQPQAPSSGAVSFSASRRRSLCA
jgi:hypothetical protein